MSEAELLAAIRDLCVTAYAYVSHGYYMQIIGAIQILAKTLTARK